MVRYTQKVPIKARRKTNGKTTGRLLIDKQQLARSPSLAHMHKD
jgi:hypothetical protein